MLKCFRWSVRLPVFLFNNLKSLSSFCKKYHKFKPFLYYISNYWTLVHTYIKHPIRIEPTTYWCLLNSKFSAFRLFWNISCGSPRPILGNKSSILSFVDFWNCLNQLSRTLSDSMRRLLETSTISFLQDLLRGRTLPDFTLISTSVGICRLENCPFF